MFKRLSTALVFATAIFLLPPGADAGFKSGVAFQPAAAPAPHPVPGPARLSSPRGRSQLAIGMHGKTPHGFHKFARHHHHRFLAFGLPFATGVGAFYGSYYDPAD